MPRLLVMLQVKFHATPVNSAADRQPWRREKCWSIQSPQTNEIQWRSEYIWVHDWVHGPNISKCCWFISTPRLTSCRSKICTAPAGMIDVRRHFSWQFHICIWKVSPKVASLWGFVILFRYGFGCWVVALRKNPRDSDRVSWTRKLCKLCKLCKL